MAPISFPLPNTEHAKTFTYFQHTTRIQSNPIAKTQIDLFKRAQYSKVLPTTTQPDPIANNPARRAPEKPIDYINKSTDALVKNLDTLKDEISAKGLRPARTGRTAIAICLAQFTVEAAEHYITSQKPALLSTLSKLASK